MIILKKIKADNFEERKYRQVTFSFFKLHEKS